MGAFLFGAGDRDRTGTGIATHGILSPGRLPVPPHRRIMNFSTMAAICQSVSRIFISSSEQMYFCLSMRTQVYGLRSAH